MQRILFSLSLVVLSSGLVKADDIMMTGPEADKVKKEIVSLLNEELKAYQSSSTTADFIERHDVDSIMYLGSERNQKLTKAQVVDEWRTGARQMVKANHFDFRVRVYDNGNVAVVDFLGGSWGRYNGKDMKGAPGSLHLLRVYVKNNGVWRTVVFNTFPNPAGKDGKAQ